MTAGASLARSLIWGAWRENREIILRARSLYRRKHKSFSRNWTTNAELRACWSVSRAQRLFNSKQNVRCGWQVPRPRCAKILALRSRRQNKPNWKHVCTPARQALTDTVGAKAWLEGWALPVEKAIEEVLMPETASPLC